MSKTKKEEKRKTFAETYAERVADPEQKMYIHDLAEAARKDLHGRLGPNHVLEDIIHPEKLKERNSAGWKPIPPFGIFKPYMFFIGSVIPNSLMKYRGLSDIAKILWARLAQYSGEDGICCPTIETLSIEVGRNPSTVIAALKKLESQGFIAILRNTADPDWSQNFYLFLMHPALLREIEPPQSKKGQITKEHQAKMQKSRKEKRDPVETFDRGTEVVGYIDVENNNEVAQGTPSKLSTGGYRKFRKAGIESFDRGVSKLSMQRELIVGELEVREPGVREPASFHASHEKHSAPAQPSPSEVDPSVENHVAPQAEIEPPKSAKPAYNEAGVACLDFYSESLPASEKKVLSLPSTNGQVIPAAAERQGRYDPKIADLYAQAEWGPQEISG